MLKATPTYDDLKWYNFYTNKEIQYIAWAEKKNDSDVGLKIFESINNPLIYIASLCDWYTAGERINTMITFLCYCSQVILRNPISVVGLGEGSSGKTFVETTALSMIPDEFILYEKRPSLASMFRRSEENPYYYDNKIVVYGDLGGDSDQDEVEATKNILKELQTDGFLNRPITIKHEGEFVVKDLILRGNPCLTYTTVPKHKFDSQELSRSFMFTPRTDNKNVYNSQKSVLELEGGKTQQVYRKMLELKEHVKSMVLGLRSKFRDILIVNPYSESLLLFIGESEYYKRDFDKYNYILKCITALNSKNRPVYNINGRDVIFTHPEDIQYFVSLFEPYKLSISHNISEKAAEIYNDLLENKSYFQGKYINEDIGLENEFGFTTNDYFEHNEKNNHNKLSKRSIQAYFSELNEQGYLKIIGKQSRSNLYTFAAESVEDIDHEVLCSLSSEAIDRLYDEYPDDVVGHIVTIDNEFNGDFNILNQHEDIVKPVWSYYDN